MIKAQSRKAVEMRIFVAIPMLDLAFQFSMRHSLTASTFSLLLDLIWVHVPSFSKAAKSVYGLRKYFLTPSKGYPTFVLLKLLFNRDR